MAKLWINQFVSGQRAEEVLMISQKELRTTNSGAYYIRCQLSDKTGKLQGRMWQATEEIFAQLPEAGFARIRGRVETYQNHLQMIIEGLSPVPEDQVDLADYLPHTEKDIPQLWDRILEMLRQVKNRHLLFLIKRFVADEALMENFRRAPAAMNMHHAYIGGLIEHTWSIMEDALLLGPRYPELNMDLILTAAFLHDIAKTMELAFTPAVAYTDAGQLIGHVVTGALWVDQRAAEVAEELGEPFPEDLLAVLKHIILSHHGEYDFGSPKLPATPEAIFIHYLDNMDAKLHMFCRDIAADPNPDSHWTAYFPSLQRKLYKKRV